jgi:hypothetical protein
LLKDYYKEFSSFSLEDRMRLYKLREDRADVIVPALQIYINVMRWANAAEIYVPKIGLADGLIQHLYADLSADVEFPYLFAKFLTMSIHTEIKKVTTHTLQRMKINGEKIAMITAYDYSFARIFDAAGIDIILVGDSASNVMAGHETTLPITLDQMIYHASSVLRGVNRAFVVVDLPFGSYQSNSKEALASAIRIMKETGAHGVKVEGGEEILESVKRILGAGVPVMGHLGLTPQSIYKFGTYSVRAKEEVEQRN